jgi:hypothetical protein
MARETDFALEIGVPSKEEFIDSVRLIRNNAANVLSICTLIQKNILYSCQYGGRSIKGRAYQGKVCD